MIDITKPLNTVVADDDMFGRLPKKPSKLIRLALRDLEAAEKSEYYKINMDTWHKVFKTRCEVCLAGAVMAGSLEGSLRKSLDPNDFMSERPALTALEALRTGFLDSALLKLNIENSSIKAKVSIASYELDPKLFKEQMSEMADAFEQHNL